MLLTTFSSAERGPELEALLDEAENLTKFIGSDTRTVAVLGDSGEGLWNLWIVIDLNGKDLVLTVNRQEQSHQLPPPRTRHCEDGKCRHYPTPAHTSLSGTPSFCHTDLP